LALQGGAAVSFSLACGSTYNFTASMMNTAQLLSEVGLVTPSPFTLPAW
jgi:hypothetical protein